MAAIKTDSNQPETMTDAEFQRALFAEIENLAKRLEHADAQLHEITQFIAEHKPALDRGMALLDPAAKLRGMVTGRKRG